jgi:hypothetical protein
MQLKLLFKSRGLELNRKWRMLSVSCYVIKFIEDFLNQKWCYQSTSWMSPSALCWLHWKKLSNLNVFESYAAETLFKSKGLELNRKWRMLSVSFYDVIQFIEDLFISKMMLSINILDVTICIMMTPLKKIVKFKYIRKLCSWNFHSNLSLPSKNQNWRVLSVNIKLFHFLINS